MGNLKSEVLLSDCVIIALYKPKVRAVVLYDRIKVKAIFHIGITSNQKCTSS